MPWTTAAKQEFSEIYRAAIAATDDSKLVQTKDRMLKILKEVELHKAKQSKLSNGAKAQAKQTEGSKGDADPIPQAAPQ